MKIYFSIWGYCDPTRTGYDTVGATFYGTEKPAPFAGIGQSEVYEIEIPDTFTPEEIKILGKKATEYMEKTNNFNPRYAVNIILKEMNK